MALNLKDLLNNVTSYFNPQSNGGNNFWSTPVARGATNVQNIVPQHIQQPIQQFAQHPSQTIQNTAGQANNFFNNTIRNQRIPLPFANFQTPKVGTLLNVMGQNPQTQQLTASAFNKFSQRQPMSPQEKQAFRQQGIAIGMMAGAVTPKVTSNIVNNFSRYISDRELTALKKTGKLPANLEGHVNLINPGELKNIIFGKGGGNKKHLVTFSKDIENLISSKAKQQSAVKGNIPQKLIESIKLNERMKGAQGGVKQNIQIKGLQQTGQQLSNQIPEISQGLTSSSKIVPQVINTKNLNISNKGKTVVDKVIEEAKPMIEAKVGKKLSNQEAKQFADQTSSVMSKTVSRQETLAWEAKLLKARQLLSDQAKTGTVTKEFIDNLVAIKSQSSDIGRKLQSFSILADPKTSGPKEAILEAVLKVNSNVDDIIKAAKGVNFNDLNQATKFYRQFVKPTLGDWNDLLRYNSMLSSPNTHIVNISSNFQGTGILAPVEKTTLGVLDFLQSKVTGKPQKYLAGEGAAYAKGYYSNLRNAAHAFADVMSGKSFSQNPDIRNVPLTTSGFKRGVENVLSIPLKALEGMDQFFTALSKGGVESSLKYRANSGIKVLDAAGQAQKEAQYRLFRGELNPQNEGYVLNAIDQVTGTIFNLRNSNNPIVSIIAKFTIPFVKTPMNILKQGVEYSPFGVTTIPGATNKLEQFNKALLGSSVGLGTAILLGSNRLTWAEPTNAKQKNAFRAAGLQPYSIKIGNNWVSYAKLHPAVAFNLAMVAAVKDSLDKKTIDDTQADTVLTGLSKWLSFFADQSYVKNIGDFIASTKGDLEGPARYLANYPNQEIPFRALMGWVTRLVDPYQRQVDPNGSILDKQIQQMMTQIPGLSQNIPARQDALGTPIQNPNQLLNAFSPNRVTTENPQKLQIYQNMQQKSLDTKNLNILKEQVKKDGQGQTTGNKYVYLDSGGDVKTIDLSFQPKEPKLTGVSELDKKLISKFKGEITQKANDIATLYKQGQLTAEEAGKQLDALKTLTAKTGGGKGKKPAKISIKSSRVSNAPAIKVKLSKAPKPKLTFKKTKTFMLVKGKATAIPKFKIKRYRNTFTSSINVL